MDFSNWLIVICGAIILLVLVDIILPQGKMSKHIKSFSALLIFVIIITPVVQIFSNFDEVKLENSIELNSSIVSNIGSRQINSTKSLLVSKLKSELNVDTVVEIDYFMSDSSPVIETVYIYLSNTGISSDNQNINIKEQIIALVQNYFNNQNIQVIVYE